MIVRVNVVLNRTVVDSDWCFDNLSFAVVIFDSKDDYSKGYQKSVTVNTGPRSSRRSYSTYLWNGAWVQTFQSFNLGWTKKKKKVEMRTNLKVRKSLARIKQKLVGLSFGLLEVLVIAKLISVICVLLIAHQ